MRNVAKGLLCAVLGWGAVTASGAAMELTLEIPACKMPPGKPLPSKFYALANKWNEFRWVRAVRPTDQTASGSGDERADGSHMYDWYTFTRMDLDGDGLCDWFLTSLAPYGTGGDSGVLNTLYFGTPSGWKRFGATIPDNQPDGLGWGKTDQQQARFAFSSDAPLVIYESRGKTPYLIGWFDLRHTSGRRNQEGYHVYRWNTHTNTLEELDKWQPGSPAAQVYDFFKKHGAVNVAESGASRIAQFDPAIEKAEFASGCKDETALKRSPHFAKACQSHKQ